MGYYREAIVEGRAFGVCMLDGIGISPERCERPEGVAVSQRPLEVQCQPLSGHYRREARIPGRLNSSLARIELCRAIFKLFTRAPT